MSTLMSKTLASVAVATALGAMSAPAMAAFEDFTIDPDSNAATVNSFTADKIVGGYLEAIVFTPTGVNTGTFDVRLRWTGGQFFSNEGSTSVPLTGLGSAYSLYALYEGSGTYSTSGAVTTFTTSVGTGNFKLYLDNVNNTLANLTTFDNDQSTATYANIFDLTLGVDGADTLLASGTPGSGTGTLNPTLSTCGGGGINCGSFGTSVSFALTAAGSAFFTDPVPFYTLSFQSGQLNNFTVAGEQIINGSMDVVFAVPEPTSLALLGLAMAGLGASLRRRK